MWYLRLALPRSSKSPELVQLLRDHTFQSHPLNDSLQNEREETAIACSKYIEVSSALQPVFGLWLIELFSAVV